MSVTLNVAKDYEFNNKNPGYGFSLEIYNKCGKERSMTFEEAVKHLEGINLVFLLRFHSKPLRKHVYLNILKISPPKTESYKIKILIFFIFLLKI